MSCDLAALQPHTCRNTYGLGSSPFARHYLGNHCYFLFLWVLRCFSSPRSPPIIWMTGLQPAGLSHSDIHGSRVICTSPWLNAAYHVLHRLQEPRHPPHALSYLFHAPLFFNLAIECCGRCLLKVVLCRLPFDCFLICSFHYHTVQFRLESLRLI